MNAEKVVESNFNIDGQIHLYTCMNLTGDRKLVNVTSVTDEGQELAELLFL